MQSRLPRRRVRETCQSTSPTVHAPLRPDGVATVRGRDGRYSRTRTNGSSRTSERSRDALDDRLRGARMPTVIVTGSGGLIGSESVAYFVEAGYDVIGVRERHAGASSSARPRPLSRRRRSCSATYDDRSARSTDRHPRRRRLSTGSSRSTRRDLELVIHTAAQPSHDWAASDPLTDFTVNANGTLNLLEATRLHKPDATFVFTSTNKVYGDQPEPPAARGARDTAGASRRSHEYFDGIPITMSDRSLPPLALRSLEGSGRPPRPGVRPLLRHADRRASAADASPARTMPARDCTASCRTSCAAR